MKQGSSMKSVPLTALNSATILHKDCLLLSEPPICTYCMSNLIFLYSEKHFKGKQVRCLTPSFTQNWG